MLFCGGWNANRHGSPPMYGRYHCARWGDGGPDDGIRLYLIVQEMLRVTD